MKWYNRVARGASKTFAPTFQRVHAQHQQELAQERQQQRQYQNMMAAENQRSRNRKSEMSQEAALRQTDPLNEINMRNARHQAMVNAATPPDVVAQRTGEEHTAKVGEIEARTKYYNEGRAPSAAGDRFKQDAMDQAARIKNFTEDYEAALEAANGDPAKISIEKVFALRSSYDSALGGKKGHPDYLRTMHDLAPQIDKIEKKEEVEAAILSKSPDWAKETNPVSGDPLTPEEMAGRAQRVREMHGVGGGATDPPQYDAGFVGPTPPGATRALAAPGAAPSAPPAGPALAGAGAGQVGIGPAFSGARSAAGAPESTMGSDDRQQFLSKQFGPGGAPAPEPTPQPSGEQLARGRNMTPAERADLMTGEAPPSPGIPAARATTRGLAAPVPPDLLTRYTQKQIQEAQKNLKMLQVQNRNKPLPEHVTLESILQKLFPQGSTAVNSAPAAAAMTR